MTATVQHGDARDRAFGRAPRKRLTAGPKSDDQAAISPDGSKLAFQSNRDGNFEIYVMNLR